MVSAPSARTPRLRHASAEDNRRLWSRFRPHLFVNGREDVPLTALVQFRLGYQIECSAKLQVHATKGYVVCRVAEISLGVEWLFHAETIVLHQMPLFDVLGDQQTFPNGNNVLLEVDLVRVPPEEVEEKLAKALPVCFSKGLQRVYIVSKRGLPALGINPALMGAFLERR
jgi:hypothetical protein